MTVCPVCLYWLARIAAVARLRPQNDKGLQRLRAELREHKQRTGEK